MPCSNSSANDLLDWIAHFPCSTYAQLVIQDLGIFSEWTQWDVLGKKFGRKLIKFWWANICLTMYCYQIPENWEQLTLYLFLEVVEIFANKSDLYLSWKKTITITCQSEQRANYWAREFLFYVKHDRRYN